MTDSQTLLTQAKCYLCLGITLGEALQLALLAQIAGGIGPGSTLGQVISTADANPNTAGIIPANPAVGAVFFQDPSITLFNEWKWSPATSTWIQTIAP